MTRFARAKGSKASNERVPESPTSWNTMKEQLLEKQTELENSVNRKKFEAMRQESYDKFLQENAQNMKTKWAEFPKLNTENKEMTCKLQERPLKKSNNNVIEGSLDNKINEMYKRNKLNQLDDFCEHLNNDIENIECKSKKNKKKLHENSKTNKNLKGEKISKQNLKINSHNVLINRDMEIIAKNEKHVEKTDNSELKNDNEENSFHQNSNVDLRKKKKKKISRIEFDSNIELNKTFDSMSNKSVNEKNMLNEKKLSSSLKKENRSCWKINKETKSNCDDLNENVTLAKSKKRKFNQKSNKDMVQSETVSELKMSESNGYCNYEHEVSNLENKSKKNKKKFKEGSDFESEKKKIKLEHKNNKLILDGSNSYSCSKIKYDSNENLINTKINENNDKISSNVKQSSNENSYITNNSQQCSLLKIKKSKLSQKSTDNLDNVHSIKKDNKILKNHMCNDNKKYKKSSTIQIKDTKKNHKKLISELQNQENREYKRRKPDIGKTFIKIDDKEEEIVKFDGFPIKESDAVRLNDLKKQMISRGIPRSEVNRTLKFERRRAEKALARDRKKICFHCRKSGHLLSDCPELMSKNIDTAGTGICYKCGSTEHMHNECKSVKGQEFKFAECFICKEQGHIASQCPDNPKGLYPQGGGCLLCGDVTHLKKNCPQNLQAKKDHFTLNRLSYASNLESLDDETQPSTVEKQRKKTVKF